MNFAYGKLQRPQTDLLIRQATREEIPQVTDLVAAALDTYSGIAPKRALELYIERATDTAARWERGDILVAMQHGQMLGTVTWFDNAVEVGFPPGWASFGTLAVHPAAQRMGVASRLVRHVINRAYPVAEALAIHTGDFMLGARKLYHELGFERVSRYDLVASKLVEMGAEDPDVDILAYRLYLGDALSG